LRIFFLLVSFPTIASTGLFRIAVTERVPCAGGVSFGRSGSDERFQGRVHFEADPKEPANARIADPALGTFGRQSNDGVRTNTQRDAEHAGHCFLKRGWHLAPKRMARASARNSDRGPDESG
jgi:hypothetical protein